MANLTISGDTSGSVTLFAPAIAGSTVLTMPNTTGTLALTSQAFPGGLIRSPQLITSGTTYTTPANCTAIQFQLIGAGGGGAGATTSRENGGAGGGTCLGYATVTPNTTYSIAIGAGGTGGNQSPTAGTAGGNTSITVGNTTYIGVGGGGGTLDNIDVPGGNGVNGYFNLQGTPGTSSIANPYTGGECLIYQTGGGTSSANANGTNATFYGAGGGGGHDAGSTSEFYGGNGFQGVILLQEYY